ncbi:branched-chain amino acid transporter permease [Arhodomonas sp. AD133]|uniref:branched-chain amino acid transporter permease n=1 Tax=Arhodomonas sp. AD133 TaxID=3415009 RepID=UPI003EB98CE1
MSEADIYILAAIGVMAGMTFATRAAPFLILGRAAEHVLVRYLGQYLPPAVMLLLVIYCVRHVDPLQAPFGLHELAGIAVTAGFHLVWRNALLSIAAGTTVFMLLERFPPLG